MDVFTHFAVPYLLLWALRRPQAERLAAGIGGYAPDLDVLTGWIGLFGPQWEFFGHRGLSHSLVGAPLYALGAMAILALPPWGRRFPRMRVWQFTPRLVGIAMAASLTHVALDGLTIWGVPLLFPFALDRVSANWFSYSVWPALAVSLFLVYRLVRGTATERVLQGSAIALAAAFVLAGGVRFATHPGAPDEGLAQPGRFEWEWRTFEPVEGGWNVSTWSFGSLVATRFFADDRPEDAGARAALDAARATADYRSFRMYSGGPIVVNVTADEADAAAWRVTFLDLMSRAHIEESGEPFRAAVGEWGVLRLLVDARGVRVAG